MRCKLILAGLLTVTAASADSLDSTDEYLDILEIEVAESVCGDKTFLRATEQSESACIDKVKGKLPVCTKLLHHRAPKAAAKSTSGRLDKAGFTQLYGDCLRSELMK